MQVTAEGYKPLAQSTTDIISAVCANDTVLMVGRASGVVHRYSLPHLTVEGQHLLRCRPYMMALNCNLSKMSIIDINGESILPHMWTCKVVLELNNCQLLRRGKELWRVGTKMRRQLLVATAYAGVAVKSCWKLGCPSLWRAAEAHELLTAPSNPR